MVALAVAVAVQMAPKDLAPALKAMMEGNRLVALIMVVAVAVVLLLQARHLRGTMVVMAATEAVATSLEAQLLMPAVVAVDLVQLRHLELEEAVAEVAVLHLRQAALTEKQIRVAEVAEVAEASQDAMAAPAAPASSS